MKPVCVLSLATLLLACAALGCSDEEDSGDRLAELEACGARELTPCDILEPDCQERIAEIAACQWGGLGTAALLPEVTTRTEDEYRALLAQGVPARSAAQHAVDTSLALLGLSDPGDLSDEAVIAHTAERVLAYYDFETKGINLITREQPADLAEADGTLLHELIHAQQDAAYDLPALLARATPSTDGIATAQGLYEGEASFQEWLFEAMLNGLPLDADWIESSLRERRQANEDDVFLGPHVFTSALQLLPYTHGSIWMAEGWLQGGRAALQSRFEHAPASSLPLLRAGWDEDAGKAPKLLPYPTGNIYFRGAPPAPGSELIPIALDRLGPYGVYIALRLIGADPALAEQLALAWRGDQLDVYQLDAGGTAARWQAQFTDDLSASGFASLMERGRDSISVRISDRTVVCVVSESGARPEWLFGPLGAL